jgi:putative membrane protein
MGLFWILIIALIIVAVIWLARSSSGRAGPASRGATAEEILKQRYARGEIDEEEYHRRLEGLQR